MTANAEFTISIPEGKDYVLTIFHVLMTSEMTVRYLSEVNRLGETSPRPPSFLTLAERLTCGIH